MIIDLIKFQKFPKKVLTKNGNWFIIKIVNDQKIIFSKIFQ